MTPIAIIPPYGLDCPHTLAHAGYPLDVGAGAVVWVGLWCPFDFFPPPDVMGEPPVAYEEIVTWTGARTVWAL